VSDHPFEPVKLAPPVVFVLATRGEVTVDMATFTLRERAMQRAALAKLGEHMRAEYDTGLGADEFLVAGLWLVLRRTEPDLDLVELWESLTMADLTSVELPAEDGSPEA